MTETFLEDYFKNVAAKLKDIQHTDDKKAFHRMSDPTDLDEFDNAVKNMAKPICLILEMGDGDLGEWDSVADVPRIGLHILVKTTDQYAEKHAARDFAKSILNKIVSRMRRDSKVALDTTIGPLKAQGVSFASKIKYGNMSAIDGNWYGKSYYFDFKAPINLVYNTNDWLD